MSIPKWPDFKLESAGEFWHAETDTGRPVTPIFRAIVTGPTEESARAHARRYLDRAFAKAHPNGCPEVR